METQSTLRFQLYVPMLVKEVITTVLIFPGVITKKMEGFTFWL